jgi:hypothetical protein
MQVVLQLLRLVRTPDQSGKPLLSEQVLGLAPVLIDIAKAAGWIVVGVGETISQIDELILVVANVLLQKLKAGFSDPVCRKVRLNVLDVAPFTPSPGLCALVHGHREWRLPDPPSATLS